MGPPDYHAIFSQQKDKILKLILQLEASHSRSSHLNARLLTALDTLDCVQSELDLERKRTDGYASMQQAWVERLNQSEAEKDDMKQAIEMLIKKVERTNGDYRDWPRAKMYLPAPVALSVAAKHDLAELERAPATESLVHIVASERRAHAQTLEALDFAENQIAILNAKIARREAELESCNFQLDSRATRPSPVEPPRKNLAPFERKQSKFSQEEALGVLEITADRNRALERDIRGLAERLAQVRNSQREQQEEIMSNRADTCPAQDNPSVAVQTSPAASASSRSTSDCPNQLDVPPTASITKLGQQIELFAQAVERFKQERAIPLTSVAASVGDSHGLDDIPSLGHQIDLFAQAVDRFKEERVFASNSIASQKQRPEIDPPNQSDLNKVPFKRILVIEKECIRLTRLNDALNSELTDLREENRRLQEALNTCVRGTNSIFSTPSSGERDMDVSYTPLYGNFNLPTTMEHEDETDSLNGFKFLAFGPLTRSGLDNSSMDIQPSVHSPPIVFSGIIHEQLSSEQVTEVWGDRGGRKSPSQIPLPLSPDDPPSAVEAAQARMADVERELDITRREMARKQAELKDVKDLVESLWIPVGQ